MSCLGHVRPWACWIPAASRPRAADIANELEAAGPDFFLRLTGLGEVAWFFLQGGGNRCQNL